MPLQSLANYASPILCNTTFLCNKLERVYPFFSNTSDLNFVDFQGHKCNAMAEVGPQYVVEKC